MNKVLIIAYAFPPVGGGGVQRVTKFVKYLSAFNWEPIVLTVANSPVPVVDEALLREIPAGVKIFRAASLEPSYTSKKILSESGEGGAGSKIIRFVKRVLIGVLLPDVQVLWWPSLIYNLISLIRREKPQCIFVTAPPFSSFIPVVAVGRILKTPVVLDFRDEWSFSREQLENASKGMIARGLDHCFEKYVVSKCTCITTATESYLNTLAYRYRLSVGKGTVITNGFDEDDFSILQKQSENTTSDNLTIVYSGTVWKATSLQKFIAALSEVLQTVPEVRSILKFHLFGRVVDTELQSLKTPQLEDIIQVFGYVEHEKLIIEMNKADILLLVLSDLPGAEKIIAAKTFEYMATGKHIFAIVPDGETKKLIVEHYSNVTFASPDDVFDIKNKILHLIDTRGKIKQMRGENVSQFSRKQLTGKLVDVFNKVVTM